MNPAPGKIAVAETQAQIAWSSRLTYCFRKAHLFDFVTCWSHWFLFVCVFNPFFETPPSALVGARLSVISTSIFGTMILLARGRDCLPFIQEELYLHSPDLVLPFFQSLPVIFCIDFMWHGLPLWIVLVSSPAPPSASAIPSLLYVGGLGASFLLFEHLRGIKAGETYGLKGISGSTPAVLTGIALTSANLYGIATDPAPALKGWSDGLLSLGVTGPILRQRLSALLVIFGWYFMVLMFGRLPGSAPAADPKKDKPTFRDLVSDLHVKIKEMHLEGRLHELLTIQVPVPGDASAPAAAGEKRGRTRGRGEVATAAVSRPRRGSRART